MDKQAAYRALPAVHKLLTTPWAVELVKNYSHDAVTSALTTVLDTLREELQATTQTTAGIDEDWWQQRIASDQIQQKTVQQLEREFQPVLRSVLNLTGVVIHTNLGRAPLSERALAAVTTVARGYSNLEYNLTSGNRGSRHDVLERRICSLVGAEAAMVVNNNAAAVFLVLRELARGGEAVVSRGELVEIGGSFRIPAIMEESGVRLVEVGTTNKTHLWDYEQAVTEETKLLLRVHTSNFKIIGFTDRPALTDLSRVARERGILLYEDLGSGALLDYQAHGVGEEMTVKDTITSGVDVVSFSGDKLLGGAQAGIIVGRKEIIDRLKRNQLARVLRVDKMTLAALEATLIDSQDPKRALGALPVARMLTESRDDVRQRALALMEGIDQGMRQRVSHDAQKIHVGIVEESGRIGGGALPGEELAAYAVQISVEGVSAQRLFDSLRQEGTPPVVGHVVDDTVRLNVKTLFDGQIEVCTESVVTVCTKLLSTSVAANA